MRLCDFSGCGKKHEGHGLCAGHLTQLRSEKELKPLQIKNKQGEGVDPERFAAKVRRKRRRRYERMMGAIGHATQGQLDARMAYWGYRCAYCGGPYEHVDHVIPLSRGGTAWASNLRPACIHCNTSKSNKLLEEWIVPVKDVVGAAK